MFEDFENMVKGKNPFNKKTPTVSLTIYSGRDSHSSDIQHQGKNYQRAKIVVRRVFRIHLACRGYEYQTKICIEEDSLYKQWEISARQDRVGADGTRIEMQMKFPKSKNIVGCFGGEVVTLRNGNV